MTDFKPFATGIGANVQSQVDFAADPVVSTGYVAGIASSAKINKILRQTSFITSNLADLTSESYGAAVSDDGNSIFAKIVLANGVHGLARVIDTSGIANVLTGNAASQYIGLQDGYTYEVKPSVTNTGAATLSINGTSQFPIISGGSALAGGELEAGHWYTVIWNATTNHFELVGNATTAVTQPTPDSSTKIATTQFVKNQNYAPLTSPTFSGVPTVPTASLGDNSTTAASTAFVTNAITNDTIHLLKAGGTMTGDLTLANAPTATLHAATKGYVDGTTAGHTVDNGYHKFPGGFMIQWATISPATSGNNTTHSFTWPIPFAAIFTANLSGTVGEISGPSTEGAALQHMTTTGGTINQQWNQFNGNSLFLDYEKKFVVWGMGTY